MDPKETEELIALVVDEEDGRVGLGRGAPILVPAATSQAMAYTQKVGRAPSSRARPHNPRKRVPILGLSRGPGGGGGGGASHGGSGHGPRGGGAGGGGPHGGGALGPRGGGPRILPDPHRGGGGGGGRGPQHPGLPGRHHQGRFHFGHGRHGGWGWGWNGSDWAWNYWPVAVIVYDCYYYDELGNCVCPDGYYVDAYGRCAPLAGPGFAGLGNGLGIAIPSYKPSQAMPGSPGFRARRGVQVLSPPVARFGSPRIIGRAERTARGMRGGLGAAGASAFTVQAATALDEHLTTNNCAGCDDMTSGLRQLTFAFKAACLTDEKVSDLVQLNMSTALAMTGYGPGTDKALSLVLGGLRTYGGSPCTDDAGNCLGNYKTPVLPVAAQTLEQQLAAQIATIIGLQKSVPQAQSVVVPDLIAGFTALIKALPAVAITMPPVTVVTQPPVVTTQPPPAAPPATSNTSTFLIGGLIGVAVVGTVVALTMAHKKG